MEIEWLKFNKLAGFFDKFRIKKDEEEEENLEQNSQGISEEEYSAFLQSSRNGSYAYADNVLMTGIDFSQLFENKMNRIAKYNEMALFPEIGNAIEYIVDDAIVEDDEGKIINLKLLKKMPRAIEKQLTDLWEDTVNNVFKFKDNGRRLFKKWLIESELYLEMVPNKEKTDISSLKILPAFTMAPIYKGSKIEAFKQTLNHMRMPIVNESDKEKIFKSNQILYSNYGDHGENLLDTRGYLEMSVKLYNQLKSLEDALIVYRLVRAPERRVWNIAVGKMPKGKAEQYIQGLVSRYKKRDIYDPATGKVDSQQNIQALTEDYWFAQTEDGKQTSVSTIGGNGAIIGELEDIKYFIKKLYLALQIPRSRWDENYVPNNPYSIGRVGEITREEIKFSHFIEGLRRRFKTILLDCFKLRCKLHKIDEKWFGRDMVDIEFTESNLFKEFKQIEIEQARYSMFSTAYSYVRSQMNTDGFLARKFAIKKYLKFTDEELRENEKLLKEQIEEEKEQQQDQFGGGGFDQFGENQFGTGNPVDRFNQFNSEIDSEYNQDNANMNQNQNQEKEEETNRIRPGRKNLITSSRLYLDYVDNL